MNSKKRTNDIQKSVEESILEAVTRLQNDESSFNPFEGVQKPSAEIHHNHKNEPDFKGLFPSAGSQAPPFDPQTPESPFKKEGRNFAELALKPESDSARPSLPNLPEAQALANLNSVQLKLYEGDHLKIAQQRIEDLEREIERLRLENERLAAATELFQKRGEESLAAKQELEKKYQFNEERFSEERISFKNHLEERDFLIKDLRDKVEELEGRLTSDIRKSRSRERELENRLELARMERISLVGSKDEIILDLKRQVDQLNHEIGSYRRKNAEMSQTIEANQEQFRRTVRALRLALTNLEVNEQIGGRIKKAE